MTGRLPRGIMWDVKTANYLKKRPGSPFAYFIAGWAALSYGDAERAGNYFDCAIAADAGYTIAYIGKICLELSAGRFHEASLRLYRYEGLINLSSRVNMFRLCNMLSLCAFSQAERAGMGGSPGSFFSGAKYFFADFFRREPWRKKTPASGDAFYGCAGLIRYIDLCRRAAYKTASDRGAANGRRASSYRERSDLARAVCTLPGLHDAFRLTAVTEANGNPGVLDYIFDNPAIFSKALLNGLFREKILVGTLREPRVILSNLRRDSSAEYIDNANKWLFIKLSHTARRGGDVVRETARELEMGGWWADPVVRHYTIGVNI